MERKRKLQDTGLNERARINTWDKICACFLDFHIFGNIKFYAIQKLYSG